MCRAVTCSKCGKASWAGCGAHVEQVLAGVPQAQRCSCPRSAAGNSRLMIALAVAAAFAAMWMLRAH